MNEQTIQHLLESHMPVSTLAGLLVWDRMAGLIDRTVLCKAMGLDTDLLASLEARVRRYETDGVPVMGYAFEADMVIMADSKEEAETKAMSIGILRSLTIMEGP